MFHLGAFLKKFANLYATQIGLRGSGPATVSSSGGRADWSFYRKECYNCYGGISDCCQGFVGKTDIYVHNNLGGD